jgi:hypothetical protein
MLPLHSGSQVSSLRRIEWCDQSGVEFYTNELRTQRRSRRKRAGAPPTGSLTRLHPPRAGGEGIVLITDETDGRGFRLSNGYRY